MTDEVITVPLNEQITQVERDIFTSGFTSIRCKTLALLRAENYETQEGLAKAEAKQKAYQEAVDSTEKSERRYGASEETRTARYELGNAIRYIQAGKDDPLERTVSGVQVSLLTEEKARMLQFDTKEEYEELAKALEELDKLYGSSSDRSNARIFLQVKAKLMGN